MLGTILLVAALICAILAALDVHAPRVHLGWIAIALYISCRWCLAPRCASRGRPFVFPAAR
jgi:hypothetical protein